MNRNPDEKAFWPSVLRILGTILSLGLVVFLVWKNWDDFLNSFTRISLPLLVILLILAFLSRIIVTARWYVILKVVEPGLTFFKAFKLSFVGLFTTNFLPSTIGGDFVKLGGAVQLGLDSASVAGSLVVDRLVGMATMSTFLPIGILAISQGNQLSSLLFAASPAGFFDKVWKKIKSYFQRVILTLKTWIKHPVQLVVAAGLSFIHMACTFTMVFLILKELQDPVSWWISGGLWVLVYIFTYTPWAKYLESLINTIGRPISSLGLFNWVLFFIPILGYGYYRLSGLSLRFIGFFDPLWVIGHLALLSAGFLWGTKKVSHSLSILLSLTFYGCILWIFSFLPEINDYPLSLGWSETSRYYYASLFLSPIIYGRWVPLSSLHPSRYLMQAVPFLLQSNSLLFHRFWQSFIWVLTTFTAGYVLARRLKLKNKWISFGLAAWFFLFVFQGPVYYHLMVIIIIVLIGFDKDRLWRSLLIVVLASLWAGISRVNWFPVPGMLAVTLYVLEKPQKEESFWSYWGWPVIAVVVSLLGAFGSQYIYARISGNPVEVFASSFNSPLYRYRLFPNEAFGPGVIIMTINAFSVIKPQ